MQIPTRNADEAAEKVEALRVMCAGNVLVAVCLLGVLSLQVSFQSNNVQLLTRSDICSPTLGRAGVCAKVGS